MNNSITTEGGTEMEKVKIGCDTSSFDEAIEKAKQLKSLIEEVKELAASLDLKLKVSEKSML